MTAVIRRTVDAPVTLVWATVTDFAAYGRWIPLTRMRTDAGSPRVGWGFGGFSGLGPVGFLDPMLLTVWEPPTDDGAPARFRVRKTGYLLTGWAEVTLEPRDGGTRTQLTWAEQIVPRPVQVGRLLARVSDPVTARLFGRAVDGMAAAATAAGLAAAA
ncbi:SRPBCC family protein [Dermatophilaceae bacterium Soc4.6]